MTDAVATPTRRARRELHTTDTKPPQHDDIILGETLEHPEEIIVADATALRKEYADAIKFGEEPVTINLHASSEENAPMHQECWVNGKGIEFLTDEGKWRINWPGIAPGYAPVDQVFTTKRKYVEVLARKRVTKVKTIHGGTDQENPTNIVRRSTVNMAPLSIVHDNNPLGGEWFRRITGE